MDDIAKIAEVLCKSRKFESGEGTCAMSCMDQIGVARGDCRHRDRIFGELANDILSALENSK
tara:strand:- start:344 stop:529 length:186 start_codon:yes stop_codon:yes gene_type:complete